MYLIKISPLKISFNLYFRNHYRKPIITFFTIVTSSPFHFIKNQIFYYQNHDCKNFLQFFITKFISFTKIILKTFNNLHWKFRNLLKELIHHYVIKYSNFFINFFKFNLINFKQFSRYDNISSNKSKKNIHAIMSRFTFTLYNTFSNIINITIVK